MIFIIDGHESEFMVVQNKVCINFESLFMCPNNKTLGKAD